MYADKKALAHAEKNKKGWMSVGKYTDMMKAVNPWDSSEQEDKYVESDMWAFISDATNKEFRDYNTIKYAKKNNVTFGKKTVTTDF